MTPALVDATPRGEVDARRYGFRLIRRGARSVPPVRGSFRTVAEARAAGEAAAASPNVIVRVVPL